MPTAASRELSVSYGAFTMSGAVWGYLIDRMQLDRGYETSRFSCDVLVRGATEAAFASNVTAIEAACRVPRGTLTVTLGASTLLSWGHAANTGTDADPHLAKIGGEEDTARSRRYRFSVTVRHTADLSGQSGRLQSTVAVSFTPSRRRTVAISGVYTALDAVDADDQYLASIAAYATSVLSAVDSDAIFELVSERFDRDDTNKRATFARQYDEILLAQGATTDVADVISQVLNISRRSEERRVGKE